MSNDHDLLIAISLMAMPTALLVLVAVKWHVKKKTQKFVDDYKVADRRVKTPDFYSINIFAIIVAFIHFMILITLSIFGLSIFFFQKVSETAWYYVPVIVLILALCLATACLISLIRADWLDNFKPLKVAWLKRQAHEA